MFKLTAWLFSSLVAKCGRCFIFYSNTHKVVLCPSQFNSWFVFHLCHVFGICSWVVLPGLTPGVDARHWNESFPCWVAGFILRDRVRSSNSLNSGIWLGYPSNNSFWRYSRHLQLGGNLDVDPEYAGLYNPSSLGTTHDQEEIEYCRVLILLCSIFHHCASMF